MKKLDVGLSPLTNTIYAGHVLKDNQTWGVNKTDVTNEAICAVVDHIQEVKRGTGKGMELSINGKPVLPVIIEQLQGDTNE